MNKKKKLQLLSLSAALVMMCSLGGCSKNVSNTNNNESEEAVIEEVVEEPVRYEFHYYNDTVDIEEAINGLGINKNDSFPYDSYRFIRYVDYDNHEMFAIVIGYVNYITDEEGHITDTVYYYYDAFNGEFMFGTRDYGKEVKSITSDKILYLMDYGKLIDLRECVISKGLDSDYAYSVMGNDIKSKSLSTYDVARMYVLLVNSTNRYEKNDQMIIG